MNLHTPTFQMAAALVAFLALTVATGSAAMGDDTGGRKLEDTPKLTVRGDVELRRPADELQIRIGVVTESREAAEALDENSARMMEVVDALKLLGLSQDEYETGRFRVRPNYSRRPRQAGPEWKPQIIGYEVTNDVLVRTGQLDLAGELIEQANKAGANTIEVIGFTLSDPRQYRAEAIAGAARNAAADARALADAAGLTLVRVLAVNLDSSPTPVRDMGAQRMMAMASDGGAATPPITAGDVTIRASVTMVYEIAPSQ